TGTGDVVLATSPTIVTPTIASLTNAQHSHANAAGGGQISGAAALSDYASAFVNSLAGTTNQIVASGSNGAVTLAFPTGGVTLPGTTTGTFSGPLAGNASTATALAANPAACAANNWVTDMAADGTLTCAQPASTNLSDSSGLVRGGASL